MTQWIHNIVQRYKIHTQWPCAPVILERLPMLQRRLLLCPWEGSSRDGLKFDWLWNTQLCGVTWPFISWGQQDFVHFHSKHIKQVARWNTAQALKRLLVGVKTARDRHHSSFNTPLIIDLCIVLPLKNSNYSFLNWNFDQSNGDVFKHRLGIETAMAARHQSDWAHTHPWLRQDRKCPCQPRPERTRVPSEPAHSVGQPGTASSAGSPSSHHPALKRSVTFKRMPPTQIGLLCNIKWTLSERYLQQFVLYCSLKDPASKAYKWGRLLRPSSVRAGDRHTANQEQQEGTVSFLQVFNK